MSITSSDLKSVYTVTFEARNKWRNILLSLDFENGTIKNIGEKWHDNAEDCYREGLSEWLEGGERSWGDLVKALSNPTVGHIDIAVQINEEHICSVTPETKTADVVPFDRHRQFINENLIIFTNEKIGAGAFGVVFKGRYKSGECAVKVLHEVATQMQTNLPAYQEGKNTADFDRECEFLKSFQHSNIVRHLSTDKHPLSGSTILVTELMSCNLRTYLSSLSEETLTSHCQISLSKDVASGLAYIHSRHIIHRDLCGDNILLALSQPVPIAKISDFGMSRLLDPSQMSSTLTAVGHRMGYLPPEALRQQDEKYDYSLDIFSLGVIMVQIVHKVETVKTVKERTLYVSRIPDTHELQLIISECLQENMNRRPTARDIYDFLNSKKDIKTGRLVCECRAIFLSESDYFQHKQACPTRLILDSSDHSSTFSSESVDFEHQSDTISTDEEVPLVTGNNLLGVNRSVSAEVTSGVSPSKVHVMSRTISEGGETQIVKSKRRLWSRGKGRKTSNALEDKTDSEQFSEGLMVTPYKLNVDSKLNTSNNVELNEDSENKVDMQDLLEPIGVFWDIENCPVPHNKSAFSLATKIKRTFFVGKREVEFKCVCDIPKERKDVIDALYKADVTLVHFDTSTVPASEKLRPSLRKFARTYPPPSTVVLISGDANFSPELNDLRYVHNITIILLHSRQASDALKEFANTVIDFDSFLDDVDMHTVKQPAPKEPTPSMASRPTTPAKPGATGYKSIAELSASFVKLLKNSPNQEISLKTFQQNFQSFYHRIGFRVSDYLPGYATTRDLIDACEGVKVCDVQLPSDKKEAVVRLTSEPAPKEPAPSTTPAKPGATGYKSIAELSASFVKLLKNSPNQEIPLKTFQQNFQSFYHRIGFKVSDYLPGYATTRDLIDACEGVKVWDVQLPSGKKEVVVRLTSESQHRSSLSEPRGSFSGASSVVPDAPPVVSAASTMPAMSLPSSEQIPAESIQLFRKDCLEVLNSLPEKKFKDEGAGKVILEPMRVFASEIEKLLSSRPQGLPINAVVPAYKEKFGRDLVVSKLGFPKLIRALEAIADVIDIKGVGPARTIHLKPPSITVPTLPTSMIPIPPDVTLPPANILNDEVTALMVNHFTNKMTINSLTKRYNEIFCFPDGQPPVGATQLKMAIEELDNFKVTAEHVELVESILSPSPIKLSIGSQPPADTLTPKAPDKTSPQKGVVSSDHIPALVSVSPSKAKDKPSETKETPPVSPVKDAERLSSETKRLLLRQYKHSLTLDELVESFRETRDPAQPSAEMLYESLKRNNTGGQRFKISYSSNPVGDTVVQLNRFDRLFKLSTDLQYLFIYQPTATHTMLLSKIEELYEECYGHKLSSAVYGSPTVELLFDHKQVKYLIKTIQLDKTTCQCSLTKLSCQQVLVSLLSELIFVKGNKRTLSMSDLPTMYRDYFGCPLAPSSFGVTKISQLLQLPKVKQAISLDSSSSNMVLRIPNYVAEQMRHLLTIYNGQVPFSDLEHIHAQTFKFQEDIDIKKMLKNLVPLTSSVTNFAGNRKWLVWAPGGWPYPPHRRGSVIPPPTVDIQGDDSDHSPKEKNEKTFTDWPSFDDVAPLSQTEPPVGVLVDITSNSTDNQAPDLSPHGFLEEKDLGPELMAELIANAHSYEDKAKPSEEEYKKAKDQSGGVLTPTYYRELYGQAIEQMEAEERKKKPKKAGPARKKPTMAIRFPGQPSSASSSAPSVSNSNQASISGDNGRDSPLSSFSAAFLSQENCGSDEDITDKPSQVAKSSSLVIEKDATSNFQNVSTGNFSQVSTMSGMTSSFQDKTVVDVRPFVSVPANYMLCQEDTPFENKASPPDDPRVE